MLSDAELLALWEAGQGLTPVARALMILKADCPDLPIGALAALSIGARDARVLSVREQVFGRTFASLSTCPECGETVEQTFSVEEVRMPSVAASPHLMSEEVDGRIVRFKLPDSDDLSALAGCDTVAAARALLVARCVVDQPGGNVAPFRLADAAIQAIAERMARADPQADIQFAISCPSCCGTWEETFDIVSFFWSELTAWSVRILDQVHRLASAYGWSEADILAVTPSRREMYLARIGP